MKRFLLLWCLLAAGLLAASLSCVYHAPTLQAPSRMWKSTGVVIRAEVPGPPVGSLRVSWAGALAAPTAVPEEKPSPREAPPGGLWTETLPRADKSFSNLAAGDTADLYREPEAVVAGSGSVLRPGDWDFAFSIWEDGCPVSVTCRQEIYGRLDSPIQDEPVTQTAELTVSRNGCTAPVGGLKSSSVDPSPSLANNVATAPIGDYRTAVPPCRWVELWGAANEWTVAVDNAGGKRGLTMTSGSADRRLLAWDYVPAADSVEILAKVRPGANQRAAVCARAAGAAGSDNAYCAGLVDGVALRIGQYVAGVPSELLNSPFAFGSGFYWIRFRVDGSAVRAKAWADNTLDPYLANEPGWMIDDVLAGQPLGPGRVGVATDNASAGPRIEWFSVGLHGAPAPKPAPSALPAPRPERRAAGPPRRPAGSR